MQSSQGRAQYDFISVRRLHRIDRVGKLRRFGHEMKLTSLNMRLDHAHPEITGPASRKNIIERKRAKIHHKIWRYIREIHPMMKRKIRPPIYVHVVYAVHQACFRVGCHENEFFVHEQIDLQAGPMLGRIHDCHVDEPGCDLIDQILRHIDVYPKCDIRKGSTHPSNPVKQKGLSKTDFAADGQNSTTAGRDSNLMERALP